MPVILCTGFSSTITEVQAKAIGIKDFTMKPLVKNEVTALVRKVLDDHKATH
jgi:FixJ family two-component response regulator